MLDVKLVTVGFVVSEYDGAKFAAASVVDTFPAKSFVNPAETSIWSAAFASSNPSAANPVVASRAAAFALVSVTVNVVALVTTAEVISLAEKLTPGSVASPSKSQTNLFQSK